MRRPLTVVAATGGILAIGSASAFAAWLAIGSGNATAGAGNLPAPAGGVATADGPGKLTLTWNPPTPTPSSYVVTSSSTGSPGCTPTAPTCTISNLTEGAPYVFTVVAKLGGWTSPASEPFQGTAGVTPVTGTLAISTPTADATDVPTNTTITGTKSTAPDALSVVLHLGEATGTIVPATFTDGSNWTLTPTGTLLNSQKYTVVATQGTATPVTRSFTTAAPTVLLQTNPPSTPDLRLADDSGTSNTDNVTNVAKPRFSGTATAGSLVKLYRAGVEIGSQQLDTLVIDWEIMPSADVAQGKDIAVTATAQAPGRTVSNASAPLTVTFDRTAPVLSANCPQPSTTYSRTSPGNSGWDHSNKCGGVAKFDASDEHSTVATGAMRISRGTNCWTGANGSDGTTFTSAACSAAGPVGYGAGFHSAADGADNTWTKDLSQTTFATGSHTSTASAKDAAGNTSSDLSVSFTIN